METILLTGSTGCLGSHLFEELADLNDNISVKLLIRNREKFDNLLPSLKIGDLDYEVIVGDLGDFDLVQQLASNVDTVFHVAAVFDFKSKWDRFERINIDGTKAIIEAMKPGSKFILTSSDGIYGFPNLDRGMREDEDLDPQSLYHKSKRMQEDLARQLCNEKGISCVVVRPTNIVGPRDSMTVPRIIGGIKNKTLMLIRGGNHKVSIVHPQDVARAHVLAYKKIDEVDGEAFHITSINVPWKEYVHEFCHQLGVEEIERSVPYFLAYFIGFIADILPFDSIYSRFNVKFAGTNHVLDISKAREFLNYEPRYDLKQIVQESVEWYENNSDYQT